jgi:two-component system cell cycle sensor histidine kinase/response regulator CckA
MTTKKSNKTREELVEELLEKANRFELIGRIAQHTTAILDQSELFRKAVNLISHTFKYHSVNIMLVEGNEIVLKAATLPGLHHLEGKLRIKIGNEGITGWVAQKGQPLIVPDVSLDRRYYYVNQEEMKTRSEIAVPIKSKGKVIGILDAQSTNLNAFTNLDRTTLQTIADQLAISIENATLYETAQQEIDERIQAENALELSEKRFRSLYENAILGIYRTTPDGKIILANPALLRLLGYSSFEDLSKRNLEKNGFEAGYPRSYFKRQIEKNGTVIGMESAWKKKDGSALFIRESATAVYDEQGNIQYYDGTIEDITEQKELKEQLLQAQKMEAIGRLAGGIAHDFNNLILVIQGYCELVSTQLTKNDPLQKSIQQISKAGERAESLTQQLLAFSRRQVLKPKLFDLNKLVSEMKKMIRRLIGENIELLSLSDSKKGFIKADPSQIEQVIMNLVVNANDAMPAGGRLTIQTRNIRITKKIVCQHSEVNPGYYVKLSVIDTGVGIEETILNHIFEPFYTTKEKNQGTGLGLATVYGIIIQSNGQICVSSEVGKGTRFDIYLHKVRASDERADKDLLSMESFGGDETILIVEDEESVRTLACEVLRTQGYNVLEAAQGGDALLICEQHKTTIDLILTDVIMPRMSGKELVKRLLPLQPNMKVLYMSGYDSGIIKDTQSANETFNFIQKPFKPKEMMRKVREILDQNNE